MLSIGEIRDNEKGVNRIAKKAQDGMLIKERLIRARKRMGYSQARLAEKSGVALRVITKRESESGGVSSETLVALTSVLKVSIDWLCGQVGEDELNGHQKRVLTDRENRLLAAYKDFDSRALTEMYVQRAAEFITDALTNPELAQQILAQLASDMRKDDTEH